MLLFRVIKKFEKYKIPYAIVGGHAVALHGAVRGTIDIDFITKWALQNLINIQKALSELGLTPRLPITPFDLFNFKDDYIKNKNLVAWNFINLIQPSEQIDIIITLDLAKVTIKRIEVEGHTLNVLGKKDLITMKRQSGRKQDLADIESLEKIK